MAAARGSAIRMVMPVFFSFAQVREDLAKHTAGITDEQLWRQVDRQAFAWLSFEAHCRQRRSLDNLSAWRAALESAAGVLRREHDS